VSYKTQPQRTQRTTVAPDACIGALADAQLGIVTRAELNNLGVTDAAILRRVRNGRLRQLHRGVFAVGHVALSDHARWLAASRSVVEGVLTGQAAANTHRIRDRNVRAIEVLSPRAARARQGLQVRLSRSLPSRDIVTRFGIRVTSVERTIFELACTVDAESLAHVMYQAKYRRVFDEGRMREVMGRLRGRHEHSTVAAAFHLYVTGSAGARSRAERRLLKRMRAARLAVPRLNTHVHTLEGDIEVDFHWPDRRLCIELDGPHHDLPAQRRKDRERDKALREMGYRVVRIRVEEFDADGAGVVARIAELLAQGVLV